jgi:hypothetical protein
MGGVTYSGVNGILPHSYYHHNAVGGTGYTVQIGWFIKNVTEEFPSNEGAKLGWILGGAFITLIGIIGTVLSVGALAPALTTLSAALAAAAAAGSEAAVGAAVGTFVGGLGGYGAAFAALSGGAIATLIALAGTGYVVGTAISDTIRGWKKASYPDTVWGQSNSILEAEGEIPLKLTTDSYNKPNLEEDKEKLEKNPLKLKKEKMTPAEFDALRRIGFLYQIKHTLHDYELNGTKLKEGEFSDFTQAIVRTNLRVVSGKELQAEVSGITLDVSRTFNIRLFPREGNKPTADIDEKAIARESAMMAGEDEPNTGLYLKNKGSQEFTNNLSCLYWQFIPTKEHGGGWLIADRRYVRFMYFTGNGPARVYQSNEMDGLSLTTGGPPILKNQNWFGRYSPHTINKRYSSRKPETTRLGILLRAPMVNIHCT